MRDMITRLLQSGKEKHERACLQNEKCLRHTKKHISQRCVQRRRHTLPKVQIRVVLFLTLSLCIFSGCQKPPQPYGNFAGVDSADLVQDAVDALHSAYPPAKTNLVLLQPVEDAFGLSLVESLRSAGYAVAEYAPPEKSLVNTDADRSFAYTLDALQEGGELRITLHVGDETLSRLYTIQGHEGDVRHIPAGCWVRREGRSHAGQ